MMRRYLLSFIFTLSLVSLSAQETTPTCLRRFPSLLELASGEYAAPAYTHSPGFSYAGFSGCDSPAYYTPGQIQVMQMIAEGNLTAALDSIHATDSALLAASKTFQVLGQACTYLITYTHNRPTDPLNAPLFEGFNGGFASRLEHAFRWDTLSAFSAEELDKVIVTWMEVIHRGDSKMPGIYYEMLGDLTLRLGNPQISRWMSAMAYLRAGEEYRNDTIMDRYRTKAIYALESHQKNPTTFNRYRFNQLVTEFHAAWQRGLALREEIGKTSWKQDPAIQFQGTYQNRIGAFTAFGRYENFPDDVHQPLVELIEKDRVMYGDIAVNDPNRETMNRDLDVNKIKSTPAYNVFAVVMILMVIGSALFFYFRIRNRQREMDDSDQASDAEKQA